MNLTADIPVDASTASEASSPVPEPPAPHVVLSILVKKVEMGLVVQM